MSSLIQSAVETIENDTKTLLSLRAEESEKEYRKQSSLIISRIKSIEKLISNEPELIEKIEQIKSELE